MIVRVWCVCVCSYVALLLCCFSKYGSQTKCRFLLASVLGWPSLTDLSIVPRSPSIDLLRFLGEASPTKIDYREKKTKQLILTSLLEDLGTSKPPGNGGLAQSATEMRTVKFLRLTPVEWHVHPGASSTWNHPKGTPATCLLGSKRVGFLG